MDVLAGRVGRLEAGLANVRQEIWALQAAPGPSKQPPAEPGVQGETTAEWVRLFEQELLVVRRRVDAHAGMEARLQELERGAADQGQLTDDLDELSELMLEELRGLQAEVRLLSGSPDAVPGRGSRVRPPCSGGISFE